MENQLKSNSTLGREWGRRKLEKIVKSLTVPRLFFPFFFLAASKRRRCGLSLARRGNSIWDNLLCSLLADIPSGQRIGSEWNWRKIKSARHWHTQTETHAHTLVLHTHGFHLVSLNSPSWSIWFGLYGNENEKPLKGSKESHWIWFSSTLKIDVARRGVCGCVSVSAGDILCPLFAWHYTYASIWPLTSHFFIQGWHDKCWGSYS